MRFIHLTTEKDILETLPSLPSELSLDCETTDKDQRKAKLLCLVLATSDTAYQIDAEFLPLLHTTLKTRACLYLQNFKYDYHVLQRHGLDLSSVPFRDSMLLHHILDENAEHGLDAMVKHHFKDDYKEKFWAKYDAFDLAPYNEALEYVCKDGIYTYRLVEIFVKQLAGRGRLIDHVHRLSLALYQTEVLGVRIDLSLMQATQVSMKAEIDAFMPKMRESFLEQVQIWEMQAWSKELDKRKTTKGKSAVAKPIFSFSSDIQVGWLVYSGLGLPVQKKTKTGTPSTDYDTISNLSSYEPKLGLLRDYKGIKTLYNTFVEGLLAKVDNERIYPSFNVNGTVTGRISSSGPNMQNMPRDGIIRNFFLPNEGKVLIGADFSQLEVNIAANFSGDKALTRSLMEGISLHDITAEGVGIPRDQAKTLNFALQYGAGVYKISKILKISQGEAQHVLDKYWDTYSGLKSLIDACHDKVKQGQPIVNPFGRRRHFPTKFKNHWEEAEAMRQSFNALIQGTGADITHRANYLMSERLKENKSGRMLWEVHDELLAEVIPSSSQLELSALTSIMQSIGQELGFKIPLEAKGYGPLERWAKT